MRDLSINLELMTERFLRDTHVEYHVRWMSKILTTDNYFLFMKDIGDVGGNFYK